MKRYLLTVRGLILFWMGSVAAFGSFEWDVRRFDGRDYVGLDKVAEFYELSPVPAEGTERAWKGNRRHLVVRRGERQVTIDGIHHWLSFAVLERQGRLWISRLDLGKTIEPAFRPQAIAPMRPFTTVILDPGHGGHDKGASSIFELEKNFALDVARRVRDGLLKAGLRVVLTRNSDVFVELFDRADIANAKSNSIFVSLHFNASPNREATGLEIFCVTPRGSPSTEYDELLVRDMVKEYGNENELQSFALATAIHHSLHGADLEMADRGVKRARFAVLRLLRMPAVLVEGGFLSNPRDARQIATRVWRDKYAAAIVRGILEFQRLAAQKAPPRQVAEYRSGQPPRTSATPTPSSPSLQLRELPRETKPPAPTP